MSLDEDIYVPIKDVEREDGHGEVCAAIKIPPRGFATAVIAAGRGFNDTSDLDRVSRHI